MLATLALNAVALETILNPYSGIDYDEINSYYLESDCCVCNDYADFEEN